MMRRLVISFVILAFAVSPGKAQNNQQEETQAFILKVVSEYRNPLAYYTLRRDVFLPSREEIDSLEQAIDRYALYHSSPILIMGEDSLEREVFLNAHGQPLFQRKMEAHKSSRVAGHQFFRRKQNRLLSSNPNLGKFLLYNLQFKQSADLQKH